jgi:hypothetical protein
VFGHTKGCLRIGRREVPIHYQSDRINKQISSLPDILIKLKTEINAVLETPLAVEYILITNVVSLSESSVTVCVSFSFDFSSGITHSTYFKLNTAFTCAELRFLVSAKVWNNVGLLDQRYLTFYRSKSYFIGFDRRTDTLRGDCINWHYIQFM